MKRDTYTSIDDTRRGVLTVADDVLPEVYDAWGPCEEPGCSCQQFVGGGKLFGVCGNCGHRDTAHKIV